MVAAFQAYFDESGIHGDSSIFSLACYLAPMREWERFSPKWQAILDKFDIKVFHANQCNGNKGEFAKFADRRGERNTFVSELLQTISTRPRIIPLNVGVVLSDFEELYGQVTVPSPNHPYYACMKTLLAQITLVMEKDRIPAKRQVACVFDRHADISNRAMELFNQCIYEEDWEGRHRLASIGFSSLEKAIPLQAADALAYDSYHEIKRMVNYPERLPRPSYALLARGLRVEPPHIWNKERIIKFAGRPVSDSTQ